LQPGASSPPRARSPARLPKPTCAPGASPSRSDFLRSDFIRRATTAHTRMRRSKPGPP
jgi:hypothetical protein